MTTSSPLPRKKQHNNSYLNSRLTQFFPPAPTPPQNMKIALLFLTPLIAAATSNLRGPSERDLAIGWGTAAGMGNEIVWTPNPPMVGIDCTGTTVPAGCTYNNGDLNCGKDFVVEKGETVNINLGQDDKGERSSQTRRSAIIRRYSNSRRYPLMQATVAALATRSTLATICLAPTALLPLPPKPSAKSWTRKLRPRLS